jgi:8-oxo-dGTP pyrophosphatase MutT (NUDIX family)
VTDPAPIPAATVVVFRDRADGPPELLMMERSQGMSFAAGALVFPGGRIDPGDRALAATLGGDADDMAGRVAAVRECIEEAGLPVGLTALPDPATLTRLRAALHAGTALGPALASVGLGIDPSTLIPFARWLPRMVVHKIFDTRFYLARLPDGAGEASVDATENARLFWASAADVLAMCDRGEGTIIFPTRRNLERLAQFGSFADAAADAARWPVRTITPWIEGDGDARRLHIPADLGYPVTWEAMTTVQRA